MTILDQVPVPAPTLARDIGRWGLLALTINCVVGAGILGLPGRVFALAGPWIGWVLAGAALIATAATLCLAELASRFDVTGGPAQYLHAAFGPIAGFVTGWLSWSATVLGAAALLDLLADLVATEPGVRMVLLVCAGFVLTVVTMSGARRSAAASGAFTLAKLALLVALVVAGLVVPAHPARLPPGLPNPSMALVLVFFAFVGFERPSAVAGEVADARSAAPFALIAAMLAVTALYTGIFVACLRDVPGLAVSRQPVADLAARVLGPGAGRMLNLGVGLIILGTLISQWITAPRLLLALAQAGQLPAGLASLSRRRHTPDVAITATGIVATLLAIGGGFTSAVAASSASRLVIFLGCAAAMIEFRRRRDAPIARFRLPGGLLVASAVIVACAAVLATAAQELAPLAVIVLIGGLLWLFTKWARTWTARLGR
ncbi:MAG TPA: APC family permease [Caulobacteraceae bacterium]|nr:APC family permease [Caulobacteraceae bacterium]